MKKTKNLQEKAEHYAKICHYRALTGFLKEAKNYWVGNGNNIRVDYTVDDGDTIRQVLNWDDLRNAVRCYVIDNAKLIEQKERKWRILANQRKRLKVAKQKILDENKVPIIGSMRSVKWVDANGRRRVAVTARQKANQSYFPVVENGKLNWQYVGYGI